MDYACTHIVCVLRRGTPWDRRGSGSASVPSTADVEGRLPASPCGRDVCVPLLPVSCCALPRPTCPLHPIVASSPELLVARVEEHKAGHSFAGGNANLAVSSKRGQSEIQESPRSAVRSRVKLTSLILLPEVIIFLRRDSDE